MIDHVFIKNYKAFDRKNVPLDKFTLLIGTNDSGKTTILDALDLFFNGRLNQDYIRDKNNDVVVEVHIEDNRYRKVYSSPTFELNYSKCIGDMYDINHLKFLYISKSINNPKLLNDIMSVNLTKKLDAAELEKAVKVFDYIDGTLGNSTYPIFKVDTRYEMAVPKDITFTKEEYTNIVSNVTYPFLIIGIDNFEDNFIIEGLDTINKFTYQTLFTTNDQEVINNFDYFVHALYKEDVIAEFETIKKQISPNTEKSYLLVEGKYDVAWFEQGLKLLDKQGLYRVIPCGGWGNIEFVKQQLHKEGLNTVVITDGDTKSNTSLKREIIELYADLDYINSRFGTKFKTMPQSKKRFFDAIRVKDDIVKKILSSWARKRLQVDSDFVTELKFIIESN